MHITSVETTAPDLESVRAFYGSVLGLPVHSAGDRVEVRVGSTLLAFDRRPGEIHDHFAFNIPSGSITAAEQWLRARLPLLTQGARVVFAGPPTWDSQSLYFAGPTASVLELIERGALARSAGSTDQGSTFGPEGMVNVSEVGIAVDDVLAAVAALEDLGLAPYGTTPSEEFAAVGDEHGLLILVPVGRSWRPTTDRPALQTPLRLRMVTDVAGRLELGPVLLESTAEPARSG